MKRYPLIYEEKEVIRRFLRQFAFTSEQYDFSYPRWATGGRGWDRTFASGGTDTMNVLMWYHHIHKPGSKEWRPKIIMDALLHAASIESEATP